MVCPFVVPDLMDRPFLHGGTAATRVDKG